MSAAQPLQVFVVALLLAIVLEQAAQRLDLLVDGVGFGRRFLKQDFQAVALFSQLLRGVQGTLLQGRQLVLTGA